jgi:hypothetical protein
MIGLVKNIVKDFKMNKKVKFITAIYSDLHGTEFGGRPSRGGHYRWSLLSLLKMTDADFVCYTSDREIESLKEFFYVNYHISEEQLKFMVFDIAQTKYKDLIKEFKNVDESKRSDRCLEIQYAKFLWWWNEDKTYDYYFWLDAGLSHCGLIPNMYLTEKGPMRCYYESNLFNNDFLKNVIERANDKFLIIGKENQRNYWSGTVDPKWYNEYDYSTHVIGGLFGGHKSLWDNIVSIFEGYFEKITKTDHKLYMEEVIMSLMYFNHKELFNVEYFDTWWHPEGKASGIDDSYFFTNKSFYKILEDLNKIK